jgi:hypothetical protein
LWKKEIEVSQLGAALFLGFMFVSFFARLRAEPQRRLPMYDQAELRLAVTAASHVSYLPLRANNAGGVRFPESGAA